MEDLIVPLITFLLIIGGSLFKSLTANEDKNAKPVTRNPVSPSPHVEPEAEHTVQQVEVNYEDLKAEKTAQMDMLKKNLNISEKRPKNQMQKNTMLVSNRVMKKRKRLAQGQQQLAFKKRLSQNGLAESVVMAEILGPPRAVKPYSNTRR
ncbi:hypothetical protein SAMN04488134_10672 [Amphibacillus marinus]|uniref:Uncharacterized protein n=1 Tax=Amphibacillus marinus TaxID=872970 RepID=A0A1H8NQR4_9BACI|nr:hypothetical protein [Amphibacillus marinus]SEO31940.1 hypothetical protein SAMN04488134_10672 [Amphibacillus marinus]